VAPYLNVDLDITIHKGNPDNPVVVFIHGLGMNKFFWTDPVNTRVFGKNIPLKVFAASKPRICSAERRKTLTIGNIPEHIENIWKAVINRGFNAVCWSQRRPAGPITVAVEELETIMANAKKLFPGKPIALVCHSRGGLVARKCMERNKPEIKALITISTPHTGSSLSRLGHYLTPLAPALKRILPRQTHGTISQVLKNANDLLEGSALKELLPGSDFFNNLNDKNMNDVKYLSFGGKNTKLFTVYTWKKQGVKLYPEPLLTIPDSMVKYLPGSIIPDEIIPLKGDFMVTTGSSILPWAQHHYNVSANHISITWNKTVIKKTIEMLEEIQLLNKT